MAGRLQTERDCSMLSDDRLIDVALAEDIGTGDVGDWQIFQQFDEAFVFP